MKRADQIRATIRQGAKLETLPGVALSIRYVITSMFMPIIRLKMLLSKACPDSM